MTLSAGWYQSRFGKFGFLASGLPQPCAAYGQGLNKADLTDSLHCLSGMKQPEAVERQKMDASGVAR